MLVIIHNIFLVMHNEDVVVCVFNHYLRIFIFSSTFTHLYSSLFLPYSSISDHYSSCQCSCVCLFIIILRYLVGLRNKTRLSIFYSSLFIYYILYSSIADHYSSFQCSYYYNNVFMLQGCDVFRLQNAIFLCCNMRFFRFI